MKRFVTLVLLACIAMFLTACEGNYGKDKAAAEELAREQMAEIDESN